MNRSTAAALLDVLQAQRGIVAVVGAGGKKSTLYRLLAAHRTLGTNRVAVTTTVQIAVPSKALDASSIIAEPDDAIRAVRATLGAEGATLVAAPSTKPGRLAGLPRDLIERLHCEGQFDVSLVKADGARMRMIKAPNDDEPVLPAGTTTVLPIVSAKAFGKLLSPQIAHRAERLSSVIDAAIGTVLSPDHIARLLSSHRGALRHVHNAGIVPIINMVDAPERLEPARQAATAALSMTDRYDRIVLASMTRASPVVQVISR